MTMRLDSMTMRKSLTPCVRYQALIQSRKIQYDERKIGLPGGRLQPQRSCIRCVKENRDAYDSVMLRQNYYDRMDMFIMRCSSSSSASSASASTSTSKPHPEFSTSIHGDDGEDSDSQTQSAMSNPEIETQKSPPMRISGIIIIGVLAMIALFFRHVPSLMSSSSLQQIFRGASKSFTLIFLSEIGDKTFFIAALLSLTGHKLAVFSGSLVALAAMSAISVGIGSAIMAMPSLLSSPAARRAGELLSAAILVSFGVRNLSRYYNIFNKDKDDNENCSVDLQDGNTDKCLTSEKSFIEEEMEDAMEVVRKANETDKFTKSSEGNEAVSSVNKISNYKETTVVVNAMKQFAKAISLIFLAEWGDRSMIATVALSTANGPIGVFVGATLGHAIATGLAVVGGAIIGKSINERVVTITSGVLFIIFGITSMCGIF